jgi:hypothetical protein
MTKLLAAAVLLLPLAVPSPAHALGAFGLIPHGLCCVHCCECPRPYNAFTPPCCSCPVFVPVPYAGNVDGAWPGDDGGWHGPFGHGLIGHCHPKHLGKHKKHGGFDCAPDCAPAIPFDECGGCSSVIGGTVLEGGKAAPQTTTQAPPLAPPAKSAPATGAAPAGGLPSGPNLPFTLPTTTPTTPTTMPYIPVQPTSYEQPAYPAYPYGYPYAPVYGPAPYYWR